VDFLSTNGIETRPFFYPMHIMPVYSWVENCVGTMRVSEDIASRGICLPTFYDLNEDEIVYIAKKIKDFYEAQK
jgi:perosamine synthetase